ncbi:hypothetical protein E2566_08165 [Pectobacterium punjabense]|uniref:Uncharacterized protein n=1 Tax=Pectobacterium punjabense TaxID=2108399 RepID=A0ABX6L0Q6_9GAMM|nr:hypothetical protein [Pectobacterium punjabense]MBS4433258.1 hypothetical protein [Pectobacterium punjabense]PTA64128.1 hypothetical protein C9I36_11475 [Pectobacterium punjabense]QJA19894.1 hypothetical protein E2566_08165 [Pectobacterium punjabense]
MSNIEKPKKIIWFQGFTFLILPYLIIPMLYYFKFHIALLVTIPTATGTVFFFIFMNSTERNINILEKLSDAILYLFGLISLLLTILSISNIKISFQDVIEFISYGDIENSKKYIIIFSLYLLSAIAAFATIKTLLSVRSLIKYYKETIV